MAEQTQLASMRRRKLDAAFALVGVGRSLISCVWWARSSDSVSAVIWATALLITDESDDSDFLFQKVKICIFCLWAVIMRLSSGLKKWATTAPIRLFGGVEP